MKQLLCNLLEKSMGEKRRMEEMYGSACFRAKRDKEIRDIRKKTLCRYLLIGLSAILLLVFFLTGRITDRQPLKALERPKAGGESRQEALRVHMSEGREQLTQNVLLPLSSKKMSKQEVKKCLEQYQRELPQKICADHPDCSKVCSDLQLPTFDEKTGIHIRWESSRPDLISPEGRVYSLDIEKPEKVTLFAELELMDQSAEAEIPVTVMKPADSGAKRNAMGRQLQDLLSALSRSQEGAYVKLPSSLPGGIRVEWRRGDSLPFGMLLTVLCILAALAYQSRYRCILKQVEQEREEMKRDFPDFLNKLVLMLSAGMVTASALERLARDYQRRREVEKGVRPLYEALLEMCETVRQTNAPMVGELKRMARQSGLREIMRFAAIVEDNLSKGSVLVEKLSAESEILWMNRKKNAQELGRLAETKLALPLVILLAVLLIITAGPAMMTMNG